MRSPGRIPACVLLAASLGRAQDALRMPARDATVHAQVHYSASEEQHRRARPGDRHGPPAVLWLMPLSTADDAVFAAWRPHAGFRLLQKDKMFHPHLLVVAPGSSVSFPNADPFFHNVFSLFDGKRFDLGLYEAGSSKSVTFSKQGPSYIFCNIHPEMSAVVLALPSPYYAEADEHDAFELTKLLPGEYEANLWVEGATEAQVAPLRRRVHVGVGSNDLGSFDLRLPAATASHSNLYGTGYNTNTTSPYEP